MSQIRLSILDLATVPEGGTPGAAMQASVVVAQHAERWGYHRIWFAEHHNMPSIASSTPGILIGHIAAHTSHIRVGSGGIMLPNHAPLLIAEQFGTLESLYPGRIDLGIGRAPGTDFATIRALRRDPASAERFPQDVIELQTWLGPLQPGQTVRAVPGTDTNVPIYILGSSLFGAQLAAALGLPYGFASHFAPDSLLEALAVYRDQFKPSAQLDAPYVIAGFNVIAADTSEQARDLFQRNLVRRARSLAQGDVSAFSDEEVLASPVGRHARHMVKYAAVGNPDEVARELQAFIDLTGADELMIVTGIGDSRARLRSYELLAEVAGIMPGSAERSPATQTP
jgi:luciferase family oxidoreductase group 1